MQRFVALYKEPFENRKKHYHRVSRGEGIEEQAARLMEEVTRKENKNKRLELEIDELESKQRESKRELE